jgi:UDP-glucose 4-epimerase
LTHCFIIGGSGFIGTHLVRYLCNGERRLTVLGRSPQPKRTLPEGIRYVSRDYGDSCFLMGILQDVDELVILAYTTVPKTSFENPVRDILDNLPSAVKLFEMAANQGVKKIVFVSSGGTVYGKSFYLPLPEDHPTNPISPYGITKLAIEKYALMYHEIRQLPVICVRPGNAYGPGQTPFSGQGLVATAAASILLGREIHSYGADRIIRDYLHVGDMVSGIVSALERGRAGECYNIGSGVGHSTREVIEAIASCGRSHGYYPSIRELPERNFDVPVNILDSRKLMTETGWKPEVSFENGISETWHWYVENLKQFIPCP